MEFKNDTNYLDQHFLIDKDVINTLIKNCKLTSEDVVVEIGPGKGILSEIIANKVKKLILIEKDTRLSSYLDELKNNFNNIEVIYDNVLKTYIPKCNKIISSLPYSITEPFIEKLLRCDFNECFLIVGKKYADSVINRETNKLSLLTNCFFKVEKLIDIEPKSFNPMPRVMSSLIKLEKIKRENLLNNKIMFIFREMFFNRNRKLKNNLVESLIEYYKVNNMVLTKKESKILVEKLNLSNELLDKQIENINNSEFEEIYKKIDNLL